MSWLPRFALFDSCISDALDDDGPDFDGRVLVIGWRCWRVEITIARAAW